ncbi:LOW QUALITY PROTEIN: hypothetical protein U9M48_004981 [Paspalum notatum var. saurae]|uniref:Leucine-rich repeat-containing N-terminal plant-type domain-containing protein n=1 Tax=Paspalum notatum var. saurae TaxID=547442 RepID=A0AAQ3SF64_PASNO
MYLRFLQLSHNMFSESIPHDIVYLSSLHFLDVSSNNLSGLIPQHLENLTGMTTRTPDNRRDTHGVRTIIYGPYGQDFIVGDQFDELLLVMTKGQQLKYGKGLDHFVSIDLSDNSLSGEIPSNITSLDALINLNLSSNNLWGKIPVKIGAIMALQSLDVSENKLSGEIPSSLSNLTSLSYMNLSYNNRTTICQEGYPQDVNLTHSMQTTRQLCTLATVDFAALLFKRLNGSFIHGNGTSYGHETGPLSFYLGLLLGLVVGLWMVFCALLFKKAWRIAYFRLFDRCYDTIYVHMDPPWTATRPQTEETRTTLPAPDALSSGCASWQRWYADSRLVAMMNAYSSAVYSVVGLATLVPTLFTSTLSPPPSICWALWLWLPRNHSVLDKRKPKTYLQVLFRRHIGYGSGPGCSARMTKENYRLKFANTWSHKQCIFFFLYNAGFSFFRCGAEQPQHPHGGGGVCLPSEMAALLTFKKGITSDPANRLSSWQGEDCCRNRTGHVLKLHLANLDPYFVDVNYNGSMPYANALAGEISSSLLSLEHLEHLDLSMNNLGGETSPMPRFLASMRNLRYLNLNGIYYFAGTVPPQFGNLSRLQYLDLGNTVRSTDITVFANLPVLQHLSLSGMDLSSINDWPQKLNMIPSLRVVDLSYWWLDRADQKLPHFNLTKLEKLDLSVSVTKGLKHLYLRVTNLFGQLNDALENMASLQVLDLSCSQTDYVTDLNTPEMVGNFSNLCSLQILSLGFSYAPGDMTTLIESLPQCAWGKLQELHLGHNNFTGFLPPDSIGQFTSLRILDLADNNLSGIIPPGIGNCTRLIMLLIDNNNLNGSNNRLNGVITEDHFRGLTSLKALDLSYNNNLKIIVHEGWLPPFRLEYGYLASCQIGPLFPAWLQQQVSISYLHISSAVSQATHLNISNHLNGPIRTFPKNIETLYISSNSFCGILPLSFESRALQILIMFSDKIGGSIPESMRNLSSLLDLDLSGNLLEGEIPQCFATIHLDFRLLRNNSFAGKFPIVSRNSTGLKMLDLLSFPSHIVPIQSPATPFDAAPIHSRDRICANTLHLPTPFHITRLTEGWSRSTASPRRRWDV